MLIQAGDVSSCICGHLIKYDGKTWYHLGHSLTLSCSKPIPKDESTYVYPTGKKCKCDSPYRDYGKKICNNCGGILDFKGDTYYLLK